MMKKSTSDNFILFANQKDSFVHFSSPSPFLLLLFVFGLSLKKIGMYVMRKKLLDEIGLFENQDKEIKPGLKPT